MQVLPFLIPILTKDGVISKKVARALGSAMWMYDLTGGWRIGKLHKRVSAEQAARHFPTTRLDKLAPATSTTTPAPTTPDSPSPSPAPRRSTAPSS